MQLKSQFTGETRAQHSKFPVAPAYLLRPTLIVLAFVK
jgi:hypothetical protein